MSFFSDLWANVFKPVAKTAVHTAADGVLGSLVGEESFSALFDAVVQEQIANLEDSGSLSRPQKRLAKQVIHATAEDLRVRVTDMILSRENDSA